jgi:hypothetical protein
MSILPAILTIMLWAGTSCAVIFSLEFLSILYRQVSLTGGELDEESESPWYWRRLAIISTLVAIIGDIGLLIVLS